MHEDVDGEGGLFLPSPQEIEAACLEIQRGWTEEQQISRRHFRIPKTKADGVLPAAKQARDAKLELERERQRRAVTAG